MITNYDQWIWRAKDRGEWRVREMDRSYVRNCLQWCLRQRQTYTWMDNGQVYTEFFQKDNHTYAEWIACFTVRLLDPDLPE